MLSLDLLEAKKKLVKYIDHIWIKMEEIRNNNEKVERDLEVGYKTRKWAGISLEEN